MTHSLHPRLFAYLGDAAYELRVREWVIASLDGEADQSPGGLHRRASRLARCEFQAQALAALSPLLTEAERELARRARNLPIPIARRAQQKTYRQATAFEALIGYWNRVDPQRLETMWARLTPLLRNAASGTAPESHDPLDVTVDPTGA